VRRQTAVALLPLLLAACARPGDKGAEGKTAPAKVTGAPKEAELATVTLSPEAEARLAVLTAPVEERVLTGSRRLGGEVVAPPGRAVTVAAPLAGTLLAPAEGGVPSAGSAVSKGQTVFRLRPLPGASDLAAAAARLEASRAKVRRAEQLLEAGAGSQRAVEEARAEAAAAESGARSLRPSADAGEGDTLILPSPEDGVVNALRAAPGQPVAAGTPLFEIAPRDPLWVRVPVYVGDLAGIDAGRPARVRSYGDAPGAPPRPARPVTGPPSADAAAATSDLYYQIANPGAALRPGHRVEVALPLRQSEKALVVPWSAVVYDVHGGAWVYESVAPRVFSRRRVEVRRVEGELAVLSSGPAVGAAVVVQGTAELFGTELGSGK
jgi:RND family efflux transporter MFP subunit